MITNVTEVFAETYLQGMVGSTLAGILIGIGIVIALILVIAIYVYTAMAWMTIARKLKHKRPWLAWIPIANVALIYQLGGFHWAWIFLIFVPLLGWLAMLVLVIIATWKIFEKRNYPGWFSLSSIIPKVGGIFYMIAIGFVAWKDKKKK